MKKKGFIAIRVTDQEHVYLERLMKVNQMYMTDLIKYALHKTFINSKLTLSEFKERLF